MSPVRDKFRPRFHFRSRKFWSFWAEISLRQSYRFLFSQFRWEIKGASGTSSRISLLLEYGRRRIGAENMLKFWFLLFCPLKSEKLDEEGTVVVALWDDTWHLRFESSPLHFLIYRQLTLKGRTFRMKHLKTLYCSVWNRIFIAAMLLVALAK